EWNVRDSDGTLVIYDSRASHSEAATEDAGTMWTMECAARLEKPLLVCQVDDPNAKQKIVEWLASNPIGTLNVSGPSESSAPGIGEKAYALWSQVFTRRESPANGRE